jgi:hypothetical protein
MGHVETIGYTQIGVALTTKSKVTKIRSKRQRILNMVYIVNRFFSFRLY